MELSFIPAHLPVRPPYGIQEPIRPALPLHIHLLMREVFLTTVTSTPFSLGRLPFKPRPTSRPASPWPGPILATVSDTDDTISTVAFLAGATVLGTMTNPPASISFNVPNLGAG